MTVYPIIRATSPLSFAISSSTCNDVHDCRTFSSIIFNCASTIFLCTWVALHLNVPEDPWEARWKSPLRHVSWMMMALLAPEIILFNAVVDWVLSSGSLNNKFNEDPTCDWTETHALLARMGGLRIVAEDGSGKLCRDIDRVSSDVRMPTNREIQDRSKGDAVAKTITVIQTLWFAIQAAYRVRQGLIVTELELTTLGHVVLNLFVCCFWWNKPLNVQFPIDVYEKKREECRKGSSNKNTENQMEVESQRPTSQQKLSIRVRIGAYIYRNIYDPKGFWTVMIVVIYFITVGGTFGAIHCLAWNSTFPTRVEHILWRVSASVVTILPGLGFTIYDVGAVNASGMMKGLLKAVALFLAVVYCLGRFCLLAVALAALRALPERAYEAPSWTLRVPHIG